MAALLVGSAVDERATLEAAFALIDDCECLAADDNCELQGVLAASPPVLELEAAILEDLDANALFASAAKASDGASCMEQRTKRRRVGDRKKLEIALLRAEVVSLQARAEQLRKMRNKPNERREGRRITTLVAVATQPTAFRIAVSSKVEPAEASPFANVWKDLAERQRLRRAAAEMENIRLRSIVKIHQRTVKNLRAVLQRQKAFDSIHRPPVPRGKNMRNSFTPQEDATLRELDSELDQFYLATDYAFHLNGLAANAYTPTSNKLVTKLSAKKTHVLMIESSLVPMDFHEAVATMWNFHLRGSPPDHEGNADSGASLKRAYMLEQRFGSWHFSMYGCYAHRKYVDTQRGAMMYSGVIWPSHIQNQPVSGVSVTDRGRVVFSEVPHSTGPMCLCQVSSDMIISADDSFEEYAQLEALTEGVSHMKAQMSKSIREWIESAILI